MLHVRGEFVYYKGKIQVPPFVRKERAQELVFRGCKTTVCKDSIVAELNILKQIGGHANIMWLVDALRVPSRPPTLVFDDKCLSPLLSEIASENRVRQAHFLFLHMTAALAHLQTLNIVHSGIRAEVIQTAAINTRYGLWWFRLSGFRNAVTVHSTVVRSRPFLPPEYNNASQFIADPGIDVWQLGVVLLWLLQKQHVPKEFQSCVKSMIGCLPQFRPTIADLQGDGYRRPVIAYLLRRTNPSVEQELAEASSSVAEDVDIATLSAYHQSGPLLSLAIEEVQKIQPEYALATIDQLAISDTALQVFIATKTSGSSSQIIDAASEDSNDLWHMLSLLRTICLEANILARQNIAAFVLCELQSDVFSLRKELEDGIVTSELVMYVRNIDHLLDYFYRCACAWERDGRLLLPRHPRAVILEAALQRLNTNCAIDEWSAAAKKDSNLLLTRFHL